jgi:hypothetical protein
MAAGLGFKTFTTGEVLTAADTNGYLMQGVLVFASSAARAAAITSPQEGQYSYLKDTNSTEYYDGAAWIAAPIGDITGVTAGTGISGGGTSGTVTVTNDMATTITAAGDIVVGTGSGTYDNLPIGTTAQVLTADTTVSPYKIKWATPAGGGKVLQVVNALTSTQVTSATNSFVDTNLTATITPTSATSTILVILFQNGLAKNAGSAETYGELQLLRGATALVKLESQFTYTNTTLQQNIGSSGTTYLDSPATTSATTYKTQFKNVGAGGSLIVNASSSASTITLMEIGA